MKRTAFAIKTRLRGGAALRVANEMRRADRLPLEGLLAEQASRSAAYTAHVFAHSPFYREYWSDHGIRAEDLRDPAAFTSLPLLEKQTVRDNFERIRTDEATERTARVSTSGGSTGQPLRLMRDLRFPAVALEWRLLDWWGIEPWQDRAIVYRHLVVGREALKHRLLWWPSRRLQLDALAMDDASVAAFVARWNRVRPPFLLGYVGAITELARRVRRDRLDFAPATVVATTAGPLSEGAREEIAGALGGKVYDHYRSAEMPWMAGECQEQDGLHVFADLRRVEVLDGAGRAVAPGVPGEVVCTDLTNLVFPLVRYRMGDHTALRADPCPCGRSLPRIDPVRGRTSDRLILPSGRTLAGEGLTQLFARYPGAVRQFQIHQQADGSVVLRCVRGPAVDADSSIDAVRQRLVELVRGEVEVRPELVDDIAHVGGKTAFIVSDRA